MATLGSVGEVWIETPHPEEIECSVEICLARLVAIWARRGFALYGYEPGSATQPGR
jgi:hypothetical protein